jgi:hypothetical protein
MKIEPLLGTQHINLKLLTLDMAHQRLEQSQLERCDEPNLTMKLALRNIIGIMNFTTQLLNREAITMLW